MGLTVYIAACLVLAVILARRSDRRVVCFVLELWFAVWRLSNRDVGSRPKYDCPYAKACE